MSIINGGLRDAMREYQASGHKLAVLVIDEQSGHHKPYADAQEAVLRTAVELKLPVWLIELNPGMAAGKKNLPTVAHLSVAGARVCTKPHFNAFVIKAHPDLRKELEKDGVTMLVIMGYHVNQCVRATAVGGSDNPPPKKPGTQEIDRDPSKTPKLWRPGATQLGFIVLTSGWIVRPDEANWWQEPGVRFYTQV
jgi:hypothetical protein